MVYFQPFRRNSLLICALQPKIEKNSLKPLFEGRSRSLVLVMISGMSELICNRFHTKQANIGKITSFQAVPLFDALVRGELPLHHLSARNFVTKNSSLWLAHNEDFVILACTVLIQLTSVTDGQTPRPWLRRAKHSAISRKKL